MRTHLEGERSEHLSRWTSSDPFTEFDTLMRRAFIPGTVRPSGFTPAAEVVQDGDDAVVSVELPGVDVERDVAVEITGGRLVIRGERKDRHSEQHDGGTLREVRYGSFNRSFTLPRHVRDDAVSASYDAGILRVRVAGTHARPGDAQRIPATSSGQNAEIPALADAENAC